MGSGGRSSGRQPIRKSYADDSDESQSEEESEAESESEEEVYVKPKKGSKKGSAKKLPKKNAKHMKKVKKPSHPPVGEMFVTAIKRLKDNPKKGSSMAAIKGFMAEEWGLIIPDYAKKIKKFVLEAVESEEIIQTKGKGLSGRFTVKGMKPKKKEEKS